jgi:hypothetical protein
VKVSVESAETGNATQALAAYTVEGTLYQDWQKDKPAVEAKLAKRPASEDAVGHAANATLKALLNQPKLWSAESVSAFGCAF